MAEAVVSFAVERLGELLISEAKLLYGVSGQINEVQRHLERMQCFLKEADEKQNRDKRVQKWVEETRELAFKIEDVIETFAIEVVAKTNKSGFKEILRRFVCILSEGVSRHNISTQIDDIKAQLTELTQSLPTFGITKGLEEGETSNSLVNLKSRRIFYSHDVEKDFVGMKIEIEQLITALKNEQKGCEVVSICGMGGQGKTTLAKILYNHAELKSHFKAFAWVCITHQFDREKVLQQILKKLLPADRKGEVLTMDDAELVTELYKVQQEKNCLIVIDDIWTTDSWESLKPAFPVGDTASGTKILFTTRDEKVGKIGSLHTIQGLTDDEGWQLLSKKAGIDEISEGKDAFEIERIGRNMVKRCNGLPIAISSLGGILKGKLLGVWENVNKDISFYLAKGERVANDDEYYTVTQLLGLSYDSSPPRLRRCFLCFANYKEDEAIRTDELYMFWLGEGLISMEDKAEGEMMLDVAERYLDELACRSLVQVETHKTEGASWSKYRTCRVHDLIRDLCLSKVKEEKVINVIHIQRKPDDGFRASTVRRLCIHSYDGMDKSMVNSYDQHVISHIRALIVWKGRFYSEEVWPDEILSLKKFKLLRVLAASGYRFNKQNIRNISELVYLKYLSLRYCVLEELATSIVNLRNLETLDLRVKCPLTIRDVIFKLKHLKHLYLPDYFKENDRVEKLRFDGLNELELIHNYDSVYCDSQDFIRLPKLKVFHGKIIVEDNLMENIIDFIKSMKLRHSNLEIEGAGGVLCLELLECCFIDVLRINGICIFPKKYDHTRFSGRLTTLWLENSKIEEDPMILLEKLPNLRDLCLWGDAYLGTEMVCSATGFPQLEELSLNSMHSLRKWRVDKGAMQNLSYLTIYECQNMEMVPQGLRYLSSLKFLRIESMPTTFTNRIEVIDGVEGEDFYKVSHIPNIRLRF